MAPPPGYRAENVWHPDFPPRHLIDNQLTRRGATSDDQHGDSDGAAPQQQAAAGETTVVEWRQRSTAQDKAALARWFEMNLPVQAPMAGAAAMTAAERRMYAFSAQQYVAARRAGELTCVEYAAALVKRALHYKTLNCFMGACAVTPFDTLIPSACMHATWWPLKRCVFRSACMQ